MTALPAGTRLAEKYLVERLLAAGGTSRLYLGHPLNGAALVAIKELCLEPDAPDHDADVAQFRREYDLLVELDHPSLPRPLDFLEERGSWFIVEEFVPGRTLEQVMEAERLPPDEALLVVRQVLRVLRFLHERGVVYRDVKPGNIMLARDGTVRLVDFGAARRWRAGASRDTVPLGTPGYASPEHYGSGQTDARSDVYGAGVLLHALLTGTAPEEHPPWKLPAPSTLAPDLPPWLCGIVERAVSLDPDDRFQSAEEMAAALDGLHAGAAFGPMDLGPLTRTLYYPHLSDYGTYSGRVVAGLAAASFLGGLESPAVAALVLASMAIMYGTGYACNWATHRRLRVHLHTAGLHIESPRDDILLGWHQIREVRIEYWRRDPVWLDIATDARRIFVDAWPGLPTLIDEILSHAPLVEGASQGAAIRIFQQGP